MDFYKKIWFDKTGCWWKIIDKETLQPTGACGMNGYTGKHEKAETGYWLLPEFWKKGIVQEVMPVMISHLFESWKLHRLEAVIEEGNTAVAVQLKSWDLNWKENSAKAKSKTVSTSIYICTVY